MPSRGRLLFVVASLLTVSLTVTGVLMASSNRQQRDESDDSAYKYLSVFMEVFGLVNKAYVDEPEAERLIAGALEGTLDALDPFSLYVPPGAVDAYEGVREIGWRRSGMVVLKERGVAYVVAVVEGSPADEAGVQAADILTQVNGRATRETPLYEIQGILASPAETEVSLEILRLGQKMDETIQLHEFPLPSVVLEADRGVPVLRIPGFFDDTYDNVKSSLETIAGRRGLDTATDDSAGQPLPGLEVRDKLLIDLRGVAGGEEAVAYRVAGLFASGVLGVLENRRQELEVFEGDDTPTFEGRIAILVDRGTQGAAEVLASVLQASASAALLGERTFGHSGRQSLVELSDGGRLQITSAFFTGPDREPIVEGLAPDLRIRPAFRDPERENGEADAEIDADASSSAVGTVDENADGNANGDADAQVGPDAPLDPTRDRGLTFLLEDEEIEEEKLAA